MTKPQFKIAIDFDGTIVDHVWPKVGRANPDAIFWMKEWRSEGAMLILHTMRDKAALTDAKEYLRSQGIGMDAYNVSPQQHEWSTSRKVYANVYVDDAAYGCPMIKFEEFERACVDWVKVGPGVLKMVQDYYQRAA